MNPTYTFIGGDGRQYGPHPLETIQSWIGEGRLMPETQMARSDAEGWHRAGDFQEFNWAGSTGAVGAPAATATPVAVATSGVTRSVPTMAPALAAGASADAAAMAAVRSRASWFYWIAGLTAANAVADLVGAGFHFVIGTALVDAFMAMGTVSAAMRPVGIALSVLLIGTMVLFGWFASRAYRWAFIVGILLYGVDAVLCLVFSEWLSLAFHAWAIWRLVEGLRIAWAVQTARRR
jgi:hypothetical protein